MQERRLRLGDVVDDYCPRERRITNHAVVAMIDQQVKHTRCTTCDAEHEYKEGKIPPRRLKKDQTAALYDEVLEGVEAERLVRASKPRPDTAADAAGEDEAPEHVATASAETEPADAVIPEPDHGSPELDNARPEEEGPVHRPLIRATLPRLVGQAPARPLSDFTARQAGARHQNYSGGSGSFRRGDAAGNGRGPQRGGGGPGQSSGRRGRGGPPQPGGRHAQGAPGGGGRRRRKSR